MPEPAASPGGQARDAGRLVVWRLTDGKPGHDNQSLGLAEALASLTQAEIHAIGAPRAPTALKALVRRRLSGLDRFPDPDLILGAGHGTHLGLLAARRARGGRTVVLMTPTLPPCLFDLCLVPEHDDLRPGPTVVTTCGAINRVRPGGRRDEAAGLLLVGGRSKHFQFDVEGISAQILAIADRERDLRWIVATSRRTPGELGERLARNPRENLELVPPEQTGPDWLRRRLSTAARVWVSEDSTSMVYEALSSGAAVGLLELEATRAGRLVRGVAELVRSGRVTRFRRWADGTALTRPEAPLDEAGRCARLILERRRGLWRR